VARNGSGWDESHCDRAVPLVQGHRGMAYGVPSCDEDCEELDVGAGGADPT